MRPSSLKDTKLWPCDLYFFMLCPTTSSHLARCSGSSTNAYTASMGASRVTSQRARSTGSPGLASSVSVSRYTVRSEMVSFSQLSASGGFRVQLRSSRNSDALTGTSFFREGNRGRPGRPGAERVRMSCRFGLFSFPTLEPSQKQASSVFVRTNQVHDASPWKHRRTLRNIPQKEPYPELTAPHNGFPFAKEQQDFFVQGTLQHPTLAAEVIHMRVIYNSSPGFVVPFPLRKKLWLESSSSDADLQEHVPGTPQLLYLYCATEL